MVLTSHLEAFFPIQTSHLEVVCAFLTSRFEAFSAGRLHLVLNPKIVPGKTTSRYDISQACENRFAHVFFCTGFVGNLKSVGSLSKSAGDAGEPLVQRSSRQ